MSLSFTLLQALLVANCVLIYSYGIRGLANRKLASRPFLLGIAGDSGSGKSTLSQGLVELFTPTSASAICGDDMHRWSRGHEMWSTYTHLNPKGNELHREISYISAIRNGLTVYRRHYDHATGDFTEELAIKSKPLMIIEGLHTFFLEPARNLLDLKIFMSPADELLLHWKTLRDMAKRGYSREQVIESLERRKADSHAYVHVQKDVADVVVTMFPLEPMGERVGEAGFAPALGMRLQFSTNFFLDPLVEDIGQLLGHRIEHHYQAERGQIVTLFEPLPLEQLELLAEKYLGQLAVIGMRIDQWNEGWAGSLQLLIAYGIAYDSSNFGQL